MLKEFTKGIWTCEAELKLVGVELGARMTVVDLDSNGCLLVHSPVKLNDNIKRQLDSLGTVKYVVAPNKWHHLFISDFKTAYPDAKFYCSPGLDRKRSDFTFDGVISNEQIFPWNIRLKHFCVEGTPVFNEVVFLDSTTKTLILTDLALHVCESQSLITKIVLSALGSYKNFGWSKIEKLMYVRNKSAFEKSIKEILSLDFDRVLLAHGTPITSGGKEYFSKTFQ